MALTDAQRIAQLESKLAKANAEITRLKAQYRRKPETARTKTKQQRKERKIALAKNPKPVNKSTRPGYNEYLRSPEWKAYRLAKFQSLGKNPVCPMCGITHLTEHSPVHHITYANFMHEKPEDTVVLCDECHDLLHAVSEDLVRNVKGMQRNYRDLHDVLHCVMMSEQDYSLCSTNEYRQIEMAYDRVIKSKERKGKIRENSVTRMQPKRAKVAAMTEEPQPVVQRQVVENGFAYKIENQPAIDTDDDELLVSNRRLVSREY